MTGSALIDFVITLVVLFGAGALFFVAIEKMAPDPFMNRIAKIAVAVVLTIVFLLAIKGLLFGGAGAVAISGGGIIGFAIGLIVILVLLFLLDKALGIFAAYVGGLLAEIIRYVVFAVALIALLVLVDRMFFGGQYTGRMLGDLGPTPQIMKSEKR